MSSRRPSSSGRKKALSFGDGLLGLLFKRRFLPGGKAQGRGLPGRKRAPRLAVSRTMVLVKSALRPAASVRQPSSKSCKRMFWMSGWAFSISSNSTTL